MVSNKSKRNLGRYVFQCGLATLIVFFILLCLDVLLGPAIVTSLGATSFIVFAMPRSRAARPRALLGSYVIGMLVGILCSLAATSSLAASTWIAADKLEVLFAALAVGWRSWPWSPPTRVTPLQRAWPSDLSPIPVIGTRSPSP